jgi:hypothetical protein
MTDSTNIADVFVYLPFMWSMGVIFGWVGNTLSARSDIEPDCVHRPLMGGLLSSPATKWPSIFGRFRIFRDLPYFLPCAAAGVVAFVVYLIALVAFREVSKLVLSWTPTTD